MLKLLVHIEDKILLSKERKVLILTNSELEDVSHWLQTNYNVTVIKIDASTIDSIVIIFATKNEYLYCKTISISKAISYLDSTEKDLEKYLKDLKTKASVKLQFALRDGRIVHISEITEKEKGLMCNCFCPGCGEKLQARLGEIKQKHFSHCGEHCNIESARQTALHIMAKEIIEKELMLFVPGIKIEREEILKEHHDSIFWQLPKEYEYKRGRMVKFDRIELEKKITDIVPDIVVYKNGKPCFIEIAVTHFVNDEKLNKVKQLGIPMLEIDISSLYGSTFNKEKLKEAILLQIDNKKWIYNSQYESAKKEAVEYYSQKYAELEYDKSCEEEAELRREMKREKIIQRTKTTISELLSPENYKNKLISLRNDSAFNGFYKTLQFYKEANEEYPFFIDLPIKGEMIFNCDRRIWQSALFDKFIYDGNMPNGIKTIVKYKSIKNWIKDQQKIFTINEELNRMVEIDGVVHVFLYEAIVQYLKYLSYIGFTYNLENRSPMFMLEKIGSVVPPKKRNAEILKNVLSEVDIFSPNINNDIENLLYYQKLAETNIEPTNTKKSVVPTYNPTTIKTKREQEEKNKLIKGFHTIKHMDFTTKTQIYDEFGRRWIKCKKCGKIMPSESMQAYQYAVGICTKCSKNTF